MGSWGCSAFPAPTKAVVLLETKQQQQWKKIIYIYISRTSLKDPNGWNQSPTKPTGNKSKISPQGQARVHVPAGAQQPGSMSRPPCSSGLGTSVMSIGMRSSSSWGKSGSDRAVPLAGSSLERGGQVERQVCDTPPPRCLSGRSRVGLATPPGMRGPLLSSQPPTRSYTREPARLWAGTMTGTAPIRSSVAWLTA